MIRDSYIIIVTIMHFFLFSSCPEYWKAPLQNVLSVRDEVQVLARTLAHYYNSDLHLPVGGKMNKQLVRGHVLYNLWFCSSNTPRGMSN